MKETVGSRIREIAIAKALKAGNPEPTAVDIAAAIGVSYESLRKWTTSATAPNRKRAAAIAAHLGVPVAAFMIGTEPVDDDDEAAPAVTYSARALRVAAIYDQVSPKDRRHIDAAADAAASPDDPPGAAMDSDDALPPGPTPAPARPS